MWNYICKVEINVKGFDICSWLELSGKENDECRNKQWREEERGESNEREL